MPHSEWGNLEEHLRSAFFEPDIEALRVALSAYCAHWLYLDNKPTWPLFIGIPGSGKSEMICTALSGLEGVIVSSEITPHTFISGAGENLHGSSLLRQMIPLPNHSNHGGVARTHGILVFKDFTSIMELRPDHRSMISAQMREIWDGRYDPHKGVKAGTWEGKLTIQAVATPAFEGAWGLKRSLGERFTSWRTKTGDGIGMAKAMLRQQHHLTIAKRTRELTRLIMPVSYKHPPSMSEDFDHVIAHAAQYAAMLRSHVERDTYPPRKIIGGVQHEAPTRLAMGMAQIASGHAFLRGSRIVEGSDVDIALKAACHCVPRTRQMVMDQIGADETLRHAVVKESELPESTVNWITEELEALGAIVIGEDSGAVTYKLTPKVATLRREMVRPVIDNVIQMPKKEAV